MQKKAQENNIAHLLFVGRVVDHKFPLIFMLDILRLCSEKFKKKFVLNVVGPIDRVYFSEIIEKLEHTSFRNQVIFTGQVSDEKLATYYKDADVFIFPSYSESFGYSIIEALYAGLPVVATRTGVVPYLEKHGFVSGVDYGDAEDMANRIYQSFRDSTSIKIKLAAQTAFFAKSFSMASFVDSLYNILI
jgi:glycosyltransferase involved in cell wall biosynthesis